MNDNTPNIAFLGTSDFATVMLDHLEEAGLLPSLIVTQPDRPKGRKMLLTPPPVKVWAEARNIPLIQPEDLKTVPPELGDKWDLFIVVAYGVILPKTILDIPERGALNVHPSLLPTLRGPSPVHSAILTDQKETGVTVMLLDEKMDHGPIISQASVVVDDWPPRRDVLEDLLGQIGGELLVDTVIPWINGDIQEEVQDDTKATYCKLIKKEDALIELEDDPYQNYLKIQAFREWPESYFFTEKDGKQIRVKIKEAAYKDDTLLITRVLPEGKSEMDYVDFKRSLED